MKTKKMNIKYHTVDADINAAKKIVKILQSGTENE